MLCLVVNPTHTSGSMNQKRTRTKIQNLTQRMITTMTTSARPGGDEKATSTVMKTSRMKTVMTDHVGSESWISRMCAHPISCLLACTLTYLPQRPPHLPRDVRDQYRSRLDKYYSSGTDYGQSAAGIIYVLATLLERTDNDLLW